MTKGGENYNNEEKNEFQFRLWVSFCTFPHWLWQTSYYWRIIEPKGHKALYIMFSDPTKNIEHLFLNKGDKVADLGAGSGFYTIASAKIVGPSGRVYAVDVQKDLLDRIKMNATHEHLSNVEILWGNIEKLGGTRLRDASVDCVIASNVLFQIEDKAQFPQEIKRILKAGGKVMIIDWSDSFGMGPSPDKVFRRADAVGLFEKDGFTFDKDFSAGEHHYGLIMRRK